MALTTLGKIEQLIAELQHVVEMIEDNETADEVLDELQCQSGTIQTIIDEATK